MNSCNHCVFYHQIRDVSDMGGTPIEVVVSQGSCGGGVCRGSVSLASGERGLEEGTTYIVSVSASNRYGQSSESGNSDPFTLVFTNSGIYITAKFI